MLTVLAILAVVEAVQPSRVELTLTGVDRAPVSAAPRSLSDVARERREGRKGVGSFSAVETTVPRNFRDVPLALDWQEPETAPEPEVVTEPRPPAYVQTYLPTSYGGRRMRAPVRRHPTSRLAEGISRRR
jgi:hypothetical protein